MIIRVEIPWGTEYEEDPRKFYIEENGSGAFYRSIEKIESFEKSIREPIKKMLLVRTFNAPDDIMHVEMNTDKKYVVFSSATIYVDDPESWKPITIPLDVFVNIADEDLKELYSISDVYTLKSRLNIQ